MVAPPDRCVADARQAPRLVRKPEVVNSETILGVSLQSWCASPVVRLRTRNCRSFYQFAHELTIPYAVVHELTIPYECRRAIDDAGETSLTQRPANIAIVAVHGSLQPAADREGGGGGRSGWPPTLPRSAQRRARRSLSARGWQLGGPARRSLRVPSPPRCHVATLRGAGLEVAP